MSRALSSSCISVSLYYNLRHSARREYDDEIGFVIQRDSSGRAHVTYKLCEYSRNIIAKSQKDTEISPQYLRRCKQKKGTPSEKGCPSSGQNQNLSVVFLWSNEKSPWFLPRRFPVLVDGKGIEPSTSAMRTPRSRKVASFLPKGCGIWFVKMQILQLDPFPTPQEQVYADHGSNAACVALRSKGTLLPQKLVFLSWNSRRKSILPSWKPPSANM